MMNDEFMEQLKRRWEEREKIIQAIAHGGPDPGNPHSHEAMKRLVHFLAQGVVLGDETYSAHPQAKFHNSIDYVLASGQKFYGSPLPEKIPRGTPRECFYNASILAVIHDEFRYCEGFAMHEGLMPVLHAWAITTDGRVIDNTFDAPENCAYLGITYDSKKYLAYIHRKKTYGVLGGKYKDAEKVLRRGGL